MNLPHFTTSWLSILMYFMLLLIVGLGVWQFVNKYVLKKPPVLSKSMVPLGFAALAFGLIGIIMSYMTTLEAADAAGKLTKIELAHALVHGSLDGAPYPILGLLCVAISFLLYYINK